MTNSELWADLAPDAEHSAIAHLVDRFERATGSRPAGWLGPALTETASTPAILAEHGFTYVMDWCNDDQPYPLRVPGGRLLSVPYSIEVNDIPLFLGAGVSPEDFARIVIDQFDVLHKESRRRPGTVMAVGLHPFLSGQPFRSKHLEAALAHVASHDDVWITTSDAIAGWYLQHSFDDAVAALARRGSVGGQGT